MNTPLSDMLSVILSGQAKEREAQAAVRQIQYENRKEQEDMARVLMRDGLFQYVKLDIQAMRRDLRKRR